MLSSIEFCLPIIQIIGIALVKIIFWHKNFTNKNSVQNSFELYLLLIKFSTIFFLFETKQNFKPKCSVRPKKIYQKLFPPELFSPKNLTTSFSINFVQPKKNLTKKYLWPKIVLSMVLHHRINFEILENGNLPIL